MTEAFSGNALVKKAGIQHEFTPEQIEEYVKCYNDVIYFAKNYCYIINLDKGLVLFDLYEYQKRMIEVFSNNRFSICVLPRQSGKTVTVCAFLLHYALFNSHKNIAILANKGATARSILSRVQRMYEHLPNWLKLGVREWNKGSMIFENETRIFAAATSSSSIRGESIDLLFCDEFAFVQQQTDFWESTYPVITSGSSSKVIIISTPNGLDLFHKIYSDAENGKNKFVPLRINWDDHPDRDEAWKEETLQNIGQEQFEQEFLCNFLGSSGTLISGDCLKTLTEKNAIYTDGIVRIYEEAKKDHSYVAVCDVSRGKGLDYSTISIIDITSMPYKQVATFRDNNITPIDFANAIFKLKSIYNDSWILVEINDIGQQVVDILYLDLDCDTLLYTENKGRHGKVVTDGYGSNVDRGIRTTTSVKAIGCNMLKLLIEKKQLLIHDAHTINELKHFSKRNNSYSAENGSHDDMVMTLVLFSWLTNQTFFKDITDINTMMAIKERNEQELYEDLVPFGYHESQLEEIESIFDL